VAVDYSRLAADYDAARADEAVDRDFWLRGLVEVGGVRPGDRILDVGAGTGRFARLLAGSSRVLALDASRAMMEASRGKGPFDRVLGDAHALPFRRNAFDVAVLVMVVHQLADLPRVLGEVARVARRAALATTDIATRQLGILEEAFPSLLRIDRRRFPPIDRLVSALEAAGFSQVTVEERRLRRTIPTSAQLERVRRKYVSTLDLIPPAEFRAGLEFLERELPRRCGEAYEIDGGFTFVGASR